MAALLYAIGTITALLLLSEVLYRKKILRGEYGRKVLHMSAGILISTWSFVLSPTQIAVLSVCAFFGLLLSKKIKLFNAIHDVKRTTVGELLYPLSVGYIALVATEPWIFTTAVLFVACADGMAAVVGKKWGSKHTTYSIFGANKSVLGNVAFLIFSYLALFVGAAAGGKDVMLAMPLTVFIVLPVLATLLESVSPYGLDNVTVPVAVTLILITVQSAF